MDHIAVLPDIRPTGDRAILKTGYQISGRISGGCWIPDIQPDTGYFRHMMNCTKILKSQIFKNEKKVFCQYPVCWISGRIFGNRISGFLTSGIWPDTG